MRETKRSERQNFAIFLPGLYFKLTFVCALVLTVLLMPDKGSSAVDLHKMWDDRCFECHGHSAEFARRSLSVSDGELQGRHHIDDLGLFLQNHYPRESDVDSIYDMLLAQASMQSRFRDECSSCHNTAAQFVRNSLAWCDGVLCSSDSERSVREFLSHHRGLDSDDVEFYTALLSRVVNEVYRR